MSRKFLIIFDNPPLPDILVLSLQCDRHKIIDTPPFKPVTSFIVTSFMDEPKDYNWVMPFCQHQKFSRNPCHVSRAEGNDLIEFKSKTSLNISKIKIVFTFFSKVLRTLSYELYRVFHVFGQAKLPDGWFGIRLEPIFNTAPAAFKNTAWFKSGQNQP